MCVPINYQNCKKIPETDKKSSKLCKCSVTKPVSVEQVFHFDNLLIQNNPNISNVHHNFEWTHD